MYAETSSLRGALDDAQTPSLGTPAVFAVRQNYNSGRVLGSMRLLLKAVRFAPQDRPARDSDRVGDVHEGEVQRELPGQMRAQRLDTVAFGGVVASGEKMQAILAGDVDGLFRRLAG